MSFQSAVAFLVCWGAATSATQAWAQASSEGPAVEGEEDASVEEITVVGSRRQTRSKTATLAPVDVIDLGAVEGRSSANMEDLLRTLVPAFNVNQQPISDAATLMRPANLRGLPPDMTVVLVNGKRRHRGAVIAFQGGGVSDGAQGVDISVIPAVALARVEVLRDGAAAQYGADAIAGVLNFVLKNNREGLNFQAQYGSTYKGDGDSLVLGANWGLPLTERGFLNLSAEFSTVDATSRSVQRSDAATLREQGNLAVPKLAQIWGSPEVRDNFKLFVNAGVDINEQVQTYLFGNYAHRTVLNGFYFRNPNTRGGVFSRDNGAMRLVGDLTPGDGFGCPAVPVGDTPELEALLEAVKADPNCFVFNELFTGGFTPQFGGDVDDFSLVGGVRGEFASGLRWDLSAGVGQSEVDFLITDTVNASLGPNTPTQFKPGTYRQTDQNLNLDLVYPWDVGVLFSPINVAAGLEYREERFTIFEGDRASFEAGPLADQGFSVGSNGFPGFSTAQAGSFTRRNVALYADLEADLLARWTLGVAGRMEHFDTFGTTATAKVATRLTLVEDGSFIDSIALRATSGTGFRAPTPGQANVSNVSTIGRPDGSLVNRGTIPPTNRLAVQRGGKELDPERSVNFGGGLVFQLLDVLSLTADYYFIRVNDRISQSANQTLTADEARDLEATDVVGAGDLGEFRFYTNAFDTTTQGMDVVASYNLDFASAGETQLSAAYNWNRTDVEYFVPKVINDQRITELQEYLPEHRFVSTVTHTWAGLRLMGRLSFFGEFKHPEGSGDFIYGSQWLADFEASYTVQRELSLVLGVRNAFNSFPDPHPNPTNTGNKYPENAPAGSNGGFWYTRLEASF